MVSKNSFKISATYGVYHDSTTSRIAASSCELLCLLCIRSPSRDNKITVVAAPTVEISASILAKPKPHIFQKDQPWSRRHLPLFLRLLGRWTEVNDEIGQALMTLEVIEFTKASAIESWQEQRGSVMSSSNTGASVDSSHPPIGALLREWRAARRLSQLDLAFEAGISARHLSCVETGKSQASRETLGRLANALGMPLREHNLLMLAAGFAPQFSETPLYTSALERMNGAIELILRHQEPYPAFVIDRHWDVLLANQAAARMISFVMGGRPLRHKNMLHNVFDPEDFRPVIVNWTDIASWFIRHLHDEIAASPSDQGSRQLLKRFSRIPEFRRIGDSVTSRVRSLRS